MVERRARWRELALAAREYCSLIEDVEQIGDRWLEQVARVLPRIHAAVVGLDSGAEGDPVYVEPDDERRFSLFSRLHRLLGERDRYWMAYDQARGKTDASDMSGSLADDFTDIYFELKRGLELLDRDPKVPSKAVGAWRQGFLWHWGQHLVDAERHLYDLQILNQVSTDRFRPMA